MFNNLFYNIFQSYITCPNEADSIFEIVKKLKLNRQFSRTF